MKTNMQKKKNQQGKNLRMIV